MKKYIIATLIASPFIAAGWAYWTLIQAEVGLMTEFPDVPERDIIRASRRMLLDALQGKFRDIPIEDDDEVFKTHFLSYVNHEYL